MSQYNKTVLTNAGLELAKRANAGQAKFEITRAVTSADDWSSKTIQDLEKVTAIPNIMQQGTVMDTEEVESNNSVIGVSLCFTNKNLSTGYQIRIIGLYVKEEGQENDFLYAVTTAITPEYMPSFADKVLYKFNMQMYLVIGKAQAVNVVINEGTTVTRTQFDKYKVEVTENLKELENTHKEDMSHVAKSASVNGGAEILPNEAGKLELVVPDPDLSKYVSLEQLGELLKTKADITAIPNKTDTEEGIKQAKAMAQEADTKAQNALDNKADKTTVEENLATKANQSDLDQTNAEVAKKANSEDVTNQLAAKANNSDVSADFSNLQNQINSKTSGTVVTAYDIASKNTEKETNSYTNYWLVDQRVLSPFADAINAIRYSPQERKTLGANDDANTISDDGVYRIAESPIKNGNNEAYCFLYVKQWDKNTIFQVLFATIDRGIYVRIISINENDYPSWTKIATDTDITNLQNQIQQLKDNQFEVQTFTDANAAANWEAQKPGHRMAIVNS